MTTLRVIVDDGALPGMIDEKDSLNMPYSNIEPGPVKVEEYISDHRFDGFGSPSQRLDILIQSNPGLKVSTILQERAAELTHEYHFDLFPGGSRMASALRMTDCRSIDEVATKVMITDLDKSLETLYPGLRTWRHESPQYMPEPIKVFLQGHPEWNYHDLRSFNAALGNDLKTSREFYLPTEQAVEGLRNYFFTERNGFWMNGMMREMQNAMTVAFKKGPAQDQLYTEVKVPRGKIEEGLATAANSFGGTPGRLNDKPFLWLFNLFMGNELNVDSERILIPTPAAMDAIRRELKEGGHERYPYLVYPPPPKDDKGWNVPDPF